MEEPIMQEEPTTQEEPIMQEELERSDEVSPEILSKARWDFTLLGLWLVLTTVIFNGMQYLAVYSWKALKPLLVKEGQVGGIFAYKGFGYWLQLLPTYLIAVPLILYLGKRLLPGTTPKRRAIKPSHFVSALACTFGIAIACNIVGLIITAILGKAMGGSVENVSTQLISRLDPLTSIFLVTIGAPVCEELIFRKMLVTRTLKYGEGVAILLSGLAFGLFHGNFNQFAYAFGIGLFFAYVFVKTGNIKITIALHACMNGFTSVVLTNLIQALDLQKLMELVSKSMSNLQDSEAFAAYVQFVTENGVLIAAIGLSILFEYGFALFGIIYLLVNLKKIRVYAGEVTIPKGKRFSIIFFNAGMIAFLGVWVFQIVAQIMGWM